MDGDLELEIGSGTEQGEYTVSVVQAPAGGHASGVFRLDVEAVLRRRPELEATVLASAVAARRSTPVAELPVRGVGQKLFQALFTREVYGIYRASLGAAQHSGQQLRVVLRIAAPELAAMPWEMLFDPETESYLCQTEPLLRHIPAPDYNLNPLDIVPPLRILGIIAAPRDLPGLDVDAETAHLAQALAGPISEGTIELVWASSGTWDDVQSRLLAGPWHVVHFIGHGDYDARTDEGRIALVGTDGRAAMVRAVRFMALLSVAMPRPRLVVLNSCSSGESGREDLFSGTASTLVRSGISAVAAMQFAISDTAAIAFAHGFYAAIANGRGVDEAARVGRISVMASPDGTLEWATPALYVRGGSTQLFTLSRPPSRAAAAEPVPAGPTDAAATPIQPDEAARLRVHHAQLRALYVQARAEMRARRYGLAVELLQDLLTLEPDYREAIDLRARALERAEVSRKYQAARAAQDTEDWGTAAEGFAAVENDPEFPDAAARRHECERRQRTSDLQDELRFHAANNSWHEVVDVAAELAALDPAAADPDGLATAARTELDRIAEASARAQRERDAAAAEQATAEQAGAEQGEQEHAAAQAAQAAVPAERVAQAAERTAAEVIAQAAVSAPRRAELGQAELGRGLLTGGGALMMLAGVVGAASASYLIWQDPDWWYSGGAVSLRLTLGLLLPAAYVLLLMAGLPDRTTTGRAVFGAAIVALVFMGWLVDIDSEASTAAAVVFGIIVSMLGFWVGVRAFRATQTPHTPGWALVVPLALQAIIWIPAEGDFTERILIKAGSLLVVHLAIVVLAGLAFILIARKNAALRETTARKEQPPWQA